MPSYVTKTRDKAVALTFIKKALKRHGLAEAITTDELRSYKAAMNETCDQWRTDGSAYRPGRSSAKLQRQGDRAQG